MPARRQATLHALCARLADGRIRLDPGADRGEVEHELLAVPGIGTVDRRLPADAGPVRPGRVHGDRSRCPTGDGTGRPAGVFRGGGGRLGAVAPVAPVRPDAPVGASYGGQAGQLDEEESHLMPTYWTSVDSPLGPLSLTADDEGLTGLHMDSEKHGPAGP